MQKRADLPKVDHSAIRVGQGSIVLTLLIAFILDLWPLVAAVAVINLLGAFVPSLSLWRLLYQQVLKPSGLIKPHVIPDHPEPHRFAQGFGGVLLVLGALLLALGFAVGGWIPVWIVILLATLNLVVGFCLGCFTYYQLNRLGVPGFDRSPVERGR